MLHQGWIRGQEGPHFRGFHSAPVLAGVGIVGFAAALGQTPLAQGALNKGAALAALPEISSRIGFGDLFAIAAGWAMLALVILAPAVQIAAIVVVALVMALDGGRPLRRALHLAFGDPEPVWQPTFSRAA